MNYNNKDQPVKERMQLERFTAEAAFEQRYLKPLQQRYVFFGMCDEDFTIAKNTGIWPCLLERERPDYLIPDAKQLFECCGTGRDGYLRIRTSKPLSMMYWMMRLEAAGFFAIWNSHTNKGYLVEALKMVEAVHHKSTTITKTRDNDLYVIPHSLIGIA